MISAISSYLYALIIYPLEMFIETVFSISMEMVPSAGYAIIFVSIAVQLLVLPMYKRADEIQAEERSKQQKLSKWIKHIKKTFKGDEQLMILSEYYRQNDYQPWFSLRGMLPLLLQVPFFIAAYHFLSNCAALDGASFYFLKDMGSPDAMFTVGGLTINVMPIAMTLINIVSGMIYTRGLPIKDKLQLYITAGVFLVLLYTSPSGLVFYWTLNNLFSLFKNIFMKVIKHPGLIAAIASILFVLAYSYKCMSRGALETSSGRIVIVIILAVGFLPAINLILERFTKKPVLPVTNEDKRIFMVSSVIMAVTTGLLIPTITIASSPAEFVIRGCYVNPLLQVIYSFTVACGIFVLWGNLIFNFYSVKARRILCLLLPVISVCTLVDLQFFRLHLGNMSMNMIYYDTFIYTIREQLFNLAVLLGIALILILIYKFKKKFFLFICYDLLCVCLILCAVNMVKIQNTLNSTVNLKNDEYYLKNDARYCLDKSGKNVIVFFLDRASGPFIPYILNEKPELADIYSDFTYYKNTMSFGTHTASGAPALLGGYEYMPLCLQDPENDSSDPHGDSAKLLPLIFAENGYKTTVFDTPYYVDMEDKTIEEYYHDVHPEINAYRVDGVVKTEEEAKRDYRYFCEAARSNFIRHGIFLGSPVIFRCLLYDNGNYLRQVHFDDRNEYASHIEELDKLPELARITDEGSNTYTFIENDTTHSLDVNLQMPDYTLEEKVDNSDFLQKWKETLDETPGNPGIKMYTDPQIQAYEVNMGALLSIGKWLEYLKSNGLYDNTRIIIAADHGYCYFLFDDLMKDVGNGEEIDLEMFMPLLMVKDFADENTTEKAPKSLVTSDEFMTNADVPALAMEGLIQNPVNPFTKNKFLPDRKYSGPLYALEASIWFSVKPDDVYNPDNWTVTDPNSPGR